MLTFETLYKVLRYGGMAGGKGEEQMSRHPSPRHLHNSTRTLEACDKPRLRASSALPVSNGLQLLD